MEQHVARIGTTAAANADAALRSMAAHGIEPTPPNFTLWFEYHAGDMPELRRTMDGAVAEGRPLDAAFMAELHRRFNALEREATILRDSSARTQDALREVVGTVGSAGADLQQFGGLLDTFGARIIDRGPDPSETIVRLAEETRAMSERSATIGHEMSRAAERIALLERSLQEARRDAMTDPLTKLLNRRAFDAAVGSLAAATEALHREMGLLLLDIDHFKSVNDRWGHPIGDAVLRMLAATLSRHLRTEDVAARYGGEEFAALLPGLTLDEAAGVAERVRAALAEQRLTIRETGTPMGAITVSIGVTARAAGETPETLMRRADDALYAAKRAGRNRVETLAPPVVVAGGPAGADGPLVLDSGWGTPGAPPRRRRSAQG